MTVQEIREQIHAVVCSICDRHYPLCSASELFISKSEPGVAKMVIHFNHSLSDYPMPITAPVIELDIVAYPAQNDTDQSRALVKLHSKFGIEYVVHSTWKMDKLDHVQHHYINQIDAINLMNFGMMFDGWLNMMGYAVANAQSMVL